MSEQRRFEEELRRHVRPLGLVVARREELEAYVQTLKSVATDFLLALEIIGQLPSPGMPATCAPIFARELVEASREELRESMEAVPKWMT